MSDCEGWKVQLSIKAGDNMLNVRGTSGGDLVGELDSLAGLAPMIDENVTAIKAMECLKSGGVPAGANSYSGGTGQGGQGQSAGGQNTAGRGCIHGPMTYRTGNGARGPWQGWFCPLPKGNPDACKAVFQNA